MNTSIVPSRRVIQAEYIPCNNPAAPRVPQFIDVVVEPNSTSDFSFITACFVAVGVGSILGMIVSIVIKIF